MIRALMVALALAGSTSFNEAHAADPEIRKAYGACRGLVRWRGFDFTAGEFTAKANEVKAGFELIDSAPDDPSAAMLKKCRDEDLMEALPEVLEHIQYNTKMCADVMVAGQDQGFQRMQMGAYLVIATDLSQGLIAVLPSNADVIAAHQKVVDIKANFSTDMAAAKDKKAEAEREILQKRKISPKGSLKITGIDAQIRAAAGTRGTFLQGHLVNDAWNTVQKPLQEIEARFTYAQAVVRKKDGTCELFQMHIVQKHLGGGRYGASQIEYHNHWEYLCDND